MQTSFSITADGDRTTVLQSISEQVQAAKTSHPDDGNLIDAVHFAITSALSQASDLHTCKVKAEIRAAVSMTEPTPAAKVKAIAKKTKKTTKRKTK